jgi:putative transposase
MKKELKNLIEILAKEDDKKNLLLELLKDEVRKVLKETLEEVALLEREAYLERKEKDRKNGYYERSLITEAGEIKDLKVPRVRNGSFRPFYLSPYERNLYSLSEVVISMYEGGLSARDVAKTLEVLLGKRYSPGWVSRITEKIEEKVERWKKRRIEKYFPIVFLDGTFLKIRRDTVEGEVVYLALGIDEDGKKELLSFFLGGEGESSTLYEELLSSLKERGLTEPLLFIGDNLSGLIEAVKKHFPQADFQLCLLHTVKRVLLKVRKRDREAVAEDLKKVYRKSSKEEFLKAFEEFEKSWGEIYSQVTSSLARHLPFLMTYLSYPEALRPFIYTTNSLERFIKEVKRRTKVIEAFPTPLSAEKIVYLVAAEMNERYKTRSLRGFQEAKEELLSIRRMKYKKSKESIELKEVTQNS